VEDSASCQFSPTNIDATLTKTGLPDAEMQLEPPLDNIPGKLVPTANQLLNKPSPLE
jgi:hypothetical protein